ncbi:DNA-binding transcriptional regulator, AcrR family [Actinokineospora alba]|uniref:DNA-binding transcriptional regulator, AcrR family n=1 Tax=Actinokineospora alba TaxID=504798 RepID=A0A1H0F2L1_9PSEU|nr:TetR/AcrR family transcriptional regulator [Actinokineospora alba]TDP69315.1 TetR family transcriptional regulator [Actinokineospora alba]SDI19481.1 DNA-binding transcriptional regulator, AcrR family [Actinokineospora alba]SDN88872.1 DNA-binding transcriptional regulator, AcrR family [Actinokineospora alba]
MSKHPVLSGVEAFASVGQGLPSRHRLTPEEVAESQRHRIVVAFLQVTAEKGYAAVTIGDIVERAGVSRQAFYQQFPSKQDCFIAAFRTAAKLTLGSISQPLSELPYTDWRAGVTATMDTYLRAMAAAPKVTWTMQIECLAAGPEVAALYHKAIGQIAELYRITYNQVVRREDPSRPPLPDEAFDVLVGGLSDRIRYCLYTKGAEAIPDLIPDFVATIMALFGEKPAPADKP